MKRSAIERRTPLVRRTPLRERREKNAYEKELDAVTPLLVQRSGVNCEAKIPGVCTGRAVLRHHRKRRTQRGSNRLVNLLHLCARCHDFLHLHTTWSYILGFLVHRHEPESREVLPGWTPEGVFVLDPNERRPDREDNWLEVLRG